MSTNISANALTTISHSWCDRNRPESQSTDWGQSLLMYGLLSSYRVTKSEKVRDYLNTWLTFHLTESVPVHYFCGSWSFALLLPDAAEVFPHLRLPLQKTAEKILDFIEKKALRNGEGVLLHNIDLPNIYVDTIYYSAVTLKKLGQFLGRDWLPTASLQIALHVERLQIQNTPYCRHAIENLGSWRAEGAWARGNGWIAMTYAELLPELAESPLRSSIKSLANSLWSELAADAAPSGGWRTLLTDPTAYEETSASAMFLYSLAKLQRADLLEEKFEPIIPKALDFLLSTISSDGKVLGVSEGTWPGNEDYYRSLATGEWWWGTGAALLALTECVKLSKR